jgi:hypothetical protein
VYVECLSSSRAVVDVDVVMMMMMEKNEVAAGLELASAARRANPI